MRYNSRKMRIFASKNVTSDPRLSVERTVGSGSWSETGRFAPCRNGGYTLNSFHEKLFPGQSVQSEEKRGSRYSLKCLFN